MEWAQKIVVSGRKLCAEVVAQNGQVSLLALPELARRGVPSVRPTVRKQLKVKFKDFTPCGADEYLANFGMQSPRDAENFQLMFKVLVDGVRYLVPALVLMRALFRPTLHLLHQMFAPNALERNCRIDCVGDSVSVVVDAAWSRLERMTRHSDLKGPLSWMMLHPSARKMADSVHQYAMAGLIAMDLPEGLTEVVFAGFKSEAKMLVTEVRLLTVTPWDVPDFPVANVATRINFFSRDRVDGRSTGKPLSIHVPAHPCGGFDLTDEEWAVVAPLLEGSRKRRQPYKICRRALFDGVLGKLAKGKSWHESTYKVGDWRNAAMSYRAWNLRGSFFEAMQALRDMR